MRESHRFPYGITMEESGNLAVFPAATIHVKSKEGEELSLIMLVDSGASVSAVPSSLAPLLGINLKKGKPLIIYGISGKKIRAWQHEVLVRLGTSEIKLPLAFLTNNNAPRVLGRDGIFNYFTIVFEESRTCSSFIDNETNIAQMIQKTTSKIPLSE